MARDAVTVTDLTINDGVARPTGTTITPANGAYIDVDGDCRGLVIEVTNSSATTAYDVTFKAGDQFVDGGVAWRAGLGDLVEEVAISTTDVFVIESARFAQIAADSLPNGAIHIDFETGMTGTIRAYRLPAYAL